MSLASRILFVVFTIFLAIGYYYGTFYLDIGSGYTAKIVCSTVLSSGRNEQSVQREEFSFIPFSIFSYSINDNYVTAQTFFGLFTRTAIYDPQSKICTLLGHSSEKPKHTKTESLKKTTRKYEGRVNREVKEINYEQLDLLLDAAFHEPNIPETGVSRRTRAVIVMQDGKLVGERYANEFSIDSPLIGWGLTETIFTTIIGKRIQEGKLSLSSSKLFPEWSNDKRKDITIDNLIKGASNLYLEFAEQNEMIYLEDSTADFAIRNSKINPSNEHFIGASNLLSKLLRESFNSQDEYWNYVRKFLNDIGLENTVLSIDNEGYFIGSSFGYAPARDWINFGNFVLNRGKINGTQVVNSDWFDYLFDSKSSNVVGGWRVNYNQSVSKLLPSDAIIATGAEEQSLILIPSCKLVIVRLGCTYPRNQWYMDGFVSLLLDNVIIP